MRDLELCYVVATRLGPVAIYRPRRRPVLGRAILLSILIYVAAFVAIAHACDDHYVCEGVVARGKYWSTITPSDATESTCSFRTIAGRKIFRECPHGSKCSVGIPYPEGEGERALPPVIKFKVRDVVHVERADEVTNNLIDEPKIP
jgi:hypothetical protein